MPDPLLPDDAETVTAPGWVHEKSEDFVADVDGDGASDGVGGATGQELKGPALARAVLDAANAQRPATRRRSSRSKPESRQAGRGQAWSGAGPDGRDPQPFGAELSKLVKARGWARPAAQARLFGAWERVVGAEIAEHCRPVALNGSELTIEAVSTAWATQLRLLAGSLLRTIAAEVGHNVVTRLHVHGPAAPSWHKGPRRVRGRGPRDTYG